VEQADRFVLKRINSESMASTDSDLNVAKVSDEVGKINLEGDVKDVSLVVLPRFY